MAEYLWKVLYNLRYPPKKVKVKRELKDMYIMADKQLHEAVKAKPNTEKGISAISSYCCYFYTEEAANEFYQSRQKQRLSNSNTKLGKSADISNDCLKRIIEFTLELCNHEMCDGDLSVGIYPCEMYKDFTKDGDCEEYECELKRILRKLEEKER